MGAVDNIDHNPNSTTASGSFHGTGMSLFQYPSQESQGQNRREHKILEEPNTAKKLMELQIVHHCASISTHQRRMLLFLVLMLLSMMIVRLSTEHGTKRLGKFLYITIDSFLIMILHY